MILMGKQNNFNILRENLQYLPQVNAMGGHSDNHCSKRTLIPPPAKSVDC